MPRSHTIDRALPGTKRVSRIISVAILLIGTLVLVWVFSPGERQRKAALDRLGVGFPADSVTALLGPPTDCPTDSLQHLQGSFPGGWAPRTATAALERMESETASRWVYPVDRRETGRCEGGDGQTEIGFDSSRQVLWYVAITGKTALRLPEGWEAEAGGP